MNRKILAKLIIFLMVATLLSACSSSQTNVPATQTPDQTNAPATQTPEQTVGANKDVRVIRLANSDTADYAVTKATKNFSEELAKLSNNKIDVQLFNDGVLGEESDTVESLNLGLLEMTRVSCGNMAEYVPELAIFNLPFIFKDVDHFWAVLDGEVGQIYGELFEKAGLKIIAFYDEGARYIFNKTKPVTSPSDLKGLKIRTMGAQSIQDSFAALGASPTPMNSGEVYTSLSQGLIDAAENNYGTIYTLKWYESAPYFSNTAHLRVPSVLICGLDYWKGLSADEQNLIMKAAEASKIYGTKIFNDEEEAAKANLIKNGCTYQELTPEQISAFSSMCNSVYEKYTKDGKSKEIFDKIMSLR